VLVDDVAVGIRAGDDLAAELLNLFDRIDRDIAGARDDDTLALEVHAPRREHALHEVGRAIACRLRPRARSAIRQRLAGEDTGLVSIGQPLVLAEHVADLTTADADIASGNVGVLADMT